MWKPFTPFNVPLQVLTTTTTKINGVMVKQRVEGRRFLASVRTFGGTESTVDGMTVVEDTATVHCWYNPDITAGSAVRMLTDGSEWEILGTPENVEMRNQWLSFKIRRVRGGA